jgi:hypothetical protein
VANAFWLVVLLFVPTVLGWAVLGVARMWRWVQSRDPGPVATNQPIERIATDLRRLNAERRELVAQPPGPGRGLRSRALTAAYVDVLTVACRVLEVSPPRVSETGRTTASEISRVESELGEKGLDPRPRGAG